MYNSESRLVSQCPLKIIHKRPVLIAQNLFTLIIHTHIIIIIYYLHFYYSNTLSRLQSSVYVLVAFETTHLTYFVALIIIRHKNEKIANRKKQLKLVFIFLHIGIDTINFTSNSKVAATLSSNGYAIDLGNKKRPIISRKSVFYTCCIHVGLIKFNFNREIVCLSLKFFAVELSKPAKI